MPRLVTKLATMKCSMGTMVSKLGPGPAGINAKSAGNEISTIPDTITLLNIPHFGMCSSLGNPAVASATAAASGVLTPQPCFPPVMPPWSPGSAKVKVRGLPAVLDTSKCTCPFGGVITITDPGQKKVTMP